MYKTLSEKLSTLAAKRIADSGIPWSQARQELREENPSLRPSDLPSDDQIESALREHYAVFDPDGHAKRLMELRTIALDVMEKLSPFQPEIFRGVLNGCADQYSPICLIIAGNPKEVEIFLLDEGIEPEVMEPPPNLPNAPDEEIYFIAETPENGYFSTHGQPVTVKLNVYEQPMSIKKKARKLPDAWQIEEETLRTANFDQLRQLVEKVELIGKTKSSESISPLL